MVVGEEHDFAARELMEFLGHFVAQLRAEGQHADGVATNVDRDGDGLDDVAVDSQEIEDGFALEYAAGDVDRVGFELGLVGGVIRAGDAYVLPVPSVIGDALRAHFAEQIAQQKPHRVAFAQLGDGLEARFIRHAAVPQK